MTPPLIPFLLGGATNFKFPPPSVLLTRTKCSEVSREVFPMVARGEFRLKLSRVEATLYEQGPGPSFSSALRRGAVGQEPRNENEGESRPKQDISPSVALVAGFMNRENRVEVENSPRRSETASSAEISEASLCWLKWDDPFE